MRETPRAKTAFADYLAMGPGRSLEKLLAHYRERVVTSGKATVPTVEIRRLEHWSAAHGWQAKLAEIAEQERQAIVAKGIADKQNRVDALNDRWLRMQRVIEARAEEHAEIPGGQTGLLVRQVKIVKLYAEIKADDDEPPAEYLEGQPHGGALRRKKKKPELVPLGPSVEVEEYAVDTGLLAELRATEKQAAQELEQWKEKQTHEHTGRDGGDIVVRVEDAREQLAARLAALADRRRAGEADRQPGPEGSGEAAV